MGQEFHRANTVWGDRGGWLGLAEICTPYA